MREGTLIFIYLYKFLELAFHIAWCVVLCVSGIRFMIECNEAKKGPLVLQCLVLVPICMALAVTNMMYNNLLTNLRFKCKTKSKLCGCLVFDCINYTMCWCCFKRFCRDKWCEWPTILKWTMKAAIFGYTISAVWRQELVMHPEQLTKPVNFVTTIKAAETMSRFKKSYLVPILFIYLLQHAIFFVLRVPLFVLYSILTVCCEKNPEFSDNEKFEDYLISYEYIDHIKES